MLKDGFLALFEEYEDGVKILLYKGSLRSQPVDELRVPPHFSPRPFWFRYLVLLSWEAAERVFIEHDEVAPDCLFQVTALPREALSH